MDSPEASHRDPQRLSLAQRRQLLDLCWQLECDIDPMILRARQLRHQGAWPQAVCLEQELLPLF